MGGSKLKDKIEAYVGIAALIGFGLLVHLGRADKSQRSPHQDANCGLCHATIADLNAEPGGFPNPSSKCRTCHLRLDEPASQQLTFHQRRDRKCLDCHTYHSPNEITVADRTFHAESKNENQRAICASCHGLNEDVRQLSEGHRAAAGLYHSDFRILAGISPSEACMLCHSDGSPSQMVASVDAEQIPKFTQHGNHPTGIRVELGKQLRNSRVRRALESDIRLFSGRIECQSCHSLSAGTQFHLIGGIDRDSLCRKCHEME